MTAAFQPYLKCLSEGGMFTAGQAQDMFGLLVDGEATEAQLGALLLGLHVRGETTDEIAGAARALRARLELVEAPDGAIDTCGTGATVPTRSTSRPPPP